MSMGDGRNEKEGENRHHESLSFHVQNGSRSCVLRIRQRTHVKTKRPGKSWPVTSPRATRHAGEQWICKLKHGSLSKGLNRRIVCGSSIGHKLDDEYESLHWIGTNRFCDTWFRL